MTPHRPAAGSFGAVLDAALRTYLSPPQAVPAAAGDRLPRPATPRSGCVSGSGEPASQRGSGLAASTSP